VVENHIYQGDAKIFVTDRMITSTGSFFFLYLSVWMAGTIVTAAYGYELKDSLFEYASSLSTVGLSIGITGPNTPSAILWIEIVGMFLGRLEFFVVFVAIGSIARKVINLFK
jgi:trk system potassium uptake protein TrkH